MWKKDDEQPDQRAAKSAMPTTGPSRPADPRAQAVIGPSISIKGDVTGSENLLIQGEVDGSVTLKDHAVGVGSEGRVQADIVGRIITVEGSVEGDLQAQEQIILRGTARVKGDIKAPRVVLEDGATFRGLVDMGSAASDAREKDKGAGSGDTASKGETGSTRAGSGDAADAASGTSDDSAKGSKSGSSVKSSSKTSSGRASASA